MTDVDLTVKIAGITFKNPLLQAPTDLTGNAENIKRCVKAGVAGIVTKSLSYSPDQRVRTRPCSFSLRKFGSGLDSGMILNSETNSPYLPEVWLRKDMPEALKACKEAGAKLGLSIVDTKLENYEKLAKVVEGAGADFVDLSLGCPNAERLGAGGASIGADVKAAEQVVRTVRKAVSIPIFVKIPQVPTYAEPAPPKVALACQKAGADAVACCEPAINGVAVDLETETFFGIPAPIGFCPGRTFKPYTLSLILETVPKLSIPVIGVSGVSVWSDVVEYVMLGCYATYSALAGLVKGLKVYPAALEGIKAFMERKGYTSIEDFRGKALRQLRSLSDFPQLESDTWVMPSPIFPVVDESRCDFCRRCETCPNAAITAEPPMKNVRVNRNNCSGCGLCVTTCPKGAIKLVDEKGTVYWDGTGTAKLWSL